VWEFIMDGSALGYATGNYIERLARRWRAAVQVYLQHSESSTLVRYEDFLSDKPAFIRDLASRVGLESRVDISHRVDHQWVHRGNSKVSWSDFFSAGNLKRIEDICHEEMEAVGYPIDQDKARH
jgi:intein-encoded DNA endonuclease-like protein